MDRVNKKDKLNKDLEDFSIEIEFEFPELSQKITDDLYYSKLLGYYLEYISSEYEWAISDKSRLLDLSNELKRIGEVEKSEDLMELWIENFQRKR